MHKLSRFNLFCFHRLPCFSWEVNFIFIEFFTKKIWVHLSTLYISRNMNRHSKMNYVKKISNYNILMTLMKCTLISQNFRNTRIFMDSWSISLFFMSNNYWKFARTSWKFLRNKSFLLVISDNFIKRWDKISDWKIGKFKLKMIRSTYSNASLNW